MYTCAGAKEIDKESGLTIRALFLLFLSEWIVLLRKW